MTTNAIDWNSVRDKILADPGVRAEYDALEAEFNLARCIIALRKASRLSQWDFAEHVGIKQPQVARIDSDKPIKFEAYTDEH
jgi:hypothetical protein